MKQLRGSIQLHTFDCTKGGIAQCAQIIEGGGVVAFPTDTVYGLGCSPYKDSAVKRIFKIKGREEKKPLPVLVLDVSAAEEMIYLGPIGQMLAKKFWPGGLTIIGPLKDHRISASVTAGKNSLAIRVPDNLCTLRILKICRHIVGTSANPSGKAAPKDARSVVESLSDLDAILIDNNPIGGKESTIIDVTGKDPVVVRKGAIDIREIMETVGNERL